MGTGLLLLAKYAGLVAIGLVWGWMIAGVLLVLSWIIPLVQGLSMRSLLSNLGVACDYVVAIIGLTAIYQVWDGVAFLVALICTILSAYVLIGRGELYRLRAHVES